MTSRPNGCAWWCRWWTPATNSLLVLYDDAQSIYERTQKSKTFSFKSVGIQAQGRTTILKINYRNTRQILQPPASSPPTC